MSQRARINPYSFAKRYKGSIGSSVITSNKIWRSKEREKPPTLLKIQAWFDSILSFRMQADPKKYIQDCFLFAFSTGSHILISNCYFFPHFKILHKLLQEWEPLLQNLLLPSWRMLVHKQMTTSLSPALTDLPHEFGDPWDLFYGHCSFAQGVLLGVIWITNRLTFRSRTILQTPLIPTSVQNNKINNDLETILETASIPRNSFQQWILWIPVVNLVNFWITVNFEKKDF